MQGIDILGWVEDLLKFTVFVESENLYILLGSYNLEMGSVCWCPFNFRKLKIFSKISTLFQEDAFAALENGICEYGYLMT